MSVSLNTAETIRRRRTLAPGPRDESRDESKDEEAMAKNDVQSTPAAGVATDAQPREAETTTRSRDPRFDIEGEPTEEQLAALAEASQQLEQASPEEIIRWAVEHFQPRLGMATAFGPEGCVILHMLSKIDPTVYVFNLETGYQFRETLELRDRIAARYGIEVEFRRPELTVEQYEALHGGPVYKRDPNQCCFDRKIKVLQQAAGELDAWMSGIRRDQSEHRAKAPIVGWDKKFGLVKISPLANWTKKQVWNLIVKEDIPYNPLHDQGYLSIGCQPCTRPVLFGEDERAGRWSGTGKVECGLHTVDD